MAAHRTAPRGGSGALRVLGFAVALAVVLGFGTLLAARIDGRSYEPFSLDSPAPDGLLGLRLWLEDLGYQVRSPGPDDSAPSPRVAILFPGAESTAPGRAGLREWVEDGNTLVVANAAGFGLPSAFGVMIQVRETYSDVKLWEAQPVLPSSGRQYGRVSGRAVSTMTPVWHTVPILKTEDGDTAVLLQRLGQGTVWHIGVDRALTNGDLRDGWGRELMVAALRGVPLGSTIEIMNGEDRAPGRVPRSASGGPDGLWEPMLTHPTGWATFVLAGLLLLYLFTQGRRLGPPLPVGLPQSRRAGVEHILAIAGLAQRAGHREAVAKYQKARLKRRIGLVARISADLDDGVFLAALAEQGSVPPEKLDALAELLAALGSADDEGALVRAVAEANRFSLE